MKKTILMVLIISLAFGANAFAKGPKNEVTVGADASQWFTDIPNPATGYFPIGGGGGQLNGEFVIVQRDGIEIGLRATDRKDGLLPVDGKKHGAYVALTGLDQGEDGRAEWNYDWHVDLRGTGTVLSDYDLTLVQTFAPKLNGKAGPFDLTFPEFTFGILDNAVLYQSSQNPAFFNDTFDPFAEGTYVLILTLKPKNGGKPLSAKIKVTVLD